LYNHPGLDWIAECAVLLASWLIYRAALGRKGRRPLAVLLLASLVVCQTGIDFWQAFRIYRVPEVAMTCNEAPASTSANVARQPIVAVAASAEVSRSR
jgi:hypothetical protein